MSWFEDNDVKKLSILQSFCFQVLKSGDKPQHVAFIMDGNRRFAEKNTMSRKEGHMKGFHKLTEVLHWTFELGIPEVTVYAFSIENFKRSPDEVKTLTGLFKEKLDRLYEEREKVKEYDVKIRLIGDISMFSLEVQQSAARIIHLSREHTRSCLNIAVAYTSRHEVAMVMGCIADGVEDGTLQTSDVNVELMDQCMYTSECRPVDLLIRTSGEIRLSDFLLWQSSFAMLCFVDQLWPDFSVWSYMTCILKYQLSYQSLRAAKELSELKQHRTTAENDLRTALSKLKTARSSSTRDANKVKELPTEEVTEEVERCLQNRCDRVDAFLSVLKLKREQFILDLLPSGCQVD